MPVVSEDFTRIWQFVDQYDAGDDITRAGLDVACDDLADGIQALLDLHYAVSAGAFTTISSTGDVTFGTAGMFVDVSKSFVGIGTTTPAQELHIATTGNTAVLIESGVDNTCQLFFGDTDSSTEARIQYNHVTEEMKFGTGGRASDLVLDGSGRLGIGASPNQELHVSTTGNTAMLIEAGAANSSQIFFGDGDSETVGRIQYSHLTDELGFGSGGIAIAWRFDSNGNFKPNLDDTYDVGAPAYRVDVMYAATGTINTSSETEKQDIEAIPDAWLDAWGDVEWYRYKWRSAVQKKGDGARWHVGAIAQRVRDAFLKRGVDPFEIGLLCHDTWEETTDAEGVVHPAGARYGLRYDEAFAMEAAWTRREIARMKET